MLNVEQAIAEVASVYQSLTGRPIQPGRYETPPEVDPAVQAENNYRQFKSLLERRAQTVAPPTSPVGMAGPSFVPAVDVVEAEREVRLMMDLPGVPRDHLSVTVTGEAICVRGERPAGALQTGLVRHRERRVGAFQRLVALPPRARREGIEATLRDGVLSIVIPTDGASAEMGDMPVEIK
jgi:HSP20 family protein